MGRLSDPRTSPPRIDARIVDLIELKADYGLHHSPGIVAVLDSQPGFDPEEFVGVSVRITSPDGATVTARVAEFGDHGPAFSFYLPGLSRNDLSIGSMVEVQAESSH